MKRSQKLMDVQAIKQSVSNMGEFRVHLLWSKTGGTVECRMWHWDGFRIGKATGYGYDKAGAALGQAIELFFPEELKTLPLPARDEDGRRSGLYGLSEYNGKRVLDGSCGKECMLEILRALGFSSVELYETGPSSSMVLAKR